ncbi:MAG TPA: tetratricopeptide repeat protein [Flavobacteriales bacterium]|nr:tetratricopeptide repeat protein [Flavobacteriales bacterium]
MPNRTADEHPFAPRRTLTRDDLQAYADGRLSPERMHEVEHALEADALARDAAEGLRMPGAQAGLKRLDGMRPQNTGLMNGWAIGTLVVALGLGAWAVLSPDDERVEPTVSATELIAPEAMPPMNSDEITAAQEQPESLLIGHEPLALHAQAVAVERGAIVVERVDRDAGIEPISPRAIPIDRHAEAAVPRIERKKKASRQLVFIHDLKLVHPQELYTADPVLALADAGVAARFSDAPTQQLATGETVMMRYLGFMEEAIARFAANDHKGCMDDMRFVLSQYPEDVNALFYAGLCAHNLGLHQRARQLLHRAAVHPVDVFDEEAEWYHALTLEKLGETDAAREAFARIASRGGFYAERAQGRAASPVR